MAVGGCSGTGEGLNRAGLVVTFDGQQPTQRFCIEFEEDSISGIELLRRSGLPLVTQIEGGLGTGVCSIDGIGSDDPTDCFKYSTTPPYRFWVYFRWTGSAWQFSNLGSSARVIRDGDIDGWSWGSGAGMPPESPDGVLDTPTATATVVVPTATAAVATKTSVPQATAASATEVPADTPVPARPTATVAAPVATAPGVAPPTVAPPVATARGEVSGLDATPRSAETQTSATVVVATKPPRTGTATPRTGAVIVVDPTQAGENEATSEAGVGDGGGGGLLAIAGFGVVAVTLLGTGGFLIYRGRNSV